MVTQTCRDTQRRAGELTFQGISDPRPGLGGSTQLQAASVAALGAAEGSCCLPSGALHLPSLAGKHLLHICLCVFGIADLHNKQQGYNQHGEG